jgi:predicted 3-demethylubiquinone-9 3-methyltransferase (glyoxalase superfamily)
MNHLRRDTIGGGEPGPCGWLKDKFGVSRQIIPTALGQLLADKDLQKAHNIMQAMLQMTKIDIAALKRAYEQNNPAQV